MSETEDSPPVVRYLTAKRFRPTGAECEESGNENRQKPGGNAGVFVIMAVLLIGVGGVVFMGPDKAMETAKSLIATQKPAAKEEPAENPVEQETKPVAAPRKHRDAAPAAVHEVRPVAARRKPLADKAPAKPAPARTADIRLGMQRRELLEAYGAPDMKATSMVGGHLVENYAYLNPSKAQQTVVLKDGQVIDTGGN